MIWFKPSSYIFLVQICVEDISFVLNHLILSPSPTEVKMVMSATNKGEKVINTPFYSCVLSCQAFEQE